MKENEIYKIIEEYLPSKEKEKTELGEVFTPIVMIDDLYSQFPKNIWSDSSCKWLDPASGIGNFSIVLFFKLMDGLDIKNEKKRAKHIIENMIYMVEINKNSVRICKNIFKKLCPDAIPNIHSGDFLKLNTDKINWPESYDCVVGNPPYNIGGIKTNGSKRTHIIFTEEGLNLLKPNGIIAYICPPSYREYDTPMNKLFIDNKGHFIHIKIYGAKDTFKLFKIQGRVDSFIYQKNKKGKTIIDDEYNIVYNIPSLDMNRHIPNFGYTIFDKIYSKVKKYGKVEAFRDTEMSSIKSELFNSKGKHKILHLITEKGKRVFKSFKKHSLLSTPKLLINGLGVPYVFYDKEGEYGPSQSPIIILKPSKSLIELSKSKLFSFIIWGLRLTGNNNLPYLFDYIPNLTSDKKYKTMEDIKESLNLTNKEIAFITENFHSYEYDDTDIIEKNVRSPPKTKSRSKKKSKKKSRK
jgi:hypothetical protein